MQDMQLLKELLEADSESEVVAALNKRGLLEEKERWQFLGNMPNNQSVVHGQQSTPTAALVEKFTNGLDAILLKHCKSKSIDPRSSAAPASMADAVEAYFGDLLDETRIRALAEENLVLYATGSRARPCLSLYDAGEGQLAENFPSTFCSLIYGSNDGSYKGAIPFVQGRFNMGGTGVLPFCSDTYKFQLIVSRVPSAVAQSNNQEWAYTLFCFFASKQNPSWKFLVGTDKHVLTAGVNALHLLPKLAAKSGEICAPRERAVASGTLVKMYDYKAPKSNVCGELFKKLQDYLLRPALPLRIIECRESYKANVMGVTVWNRFAAWERGKKLEVGFEEGASVSIKLENGETLPAEIWVFKADDDKAEEDDQPQTGLRALINGQSHARRDAQFFRNKSVQKEHIAGSMLVTLDCTDLGQDTRNALFMSNRETFREDPLLLDMFKKLQRELRDHEGLKLLDEQRYEEKIKNAVDDEQGISALEELLSSDPTLADLFGSTISGKVAAKTSNDEGGGTKNGPPQSFSGKDFPTFVERRDKSTDVTLDIPQGRAAKVSFLTDAKNNYFTRRKMRGVCGVTGNFEPTFHLFNGRLTFTCSIDKNVPVGSEVTSSIVITDKKGSGPFFLSILAKVVAPPNEADKSDKPKPRKPPTTQETASRPDIKEKAMGPDELPLTIEKIPNTERLQLVLNTTSSQLEHAKTLRSPEEEPAVTFIFKYGLALIAMGLIESAKKTEEWKKDDSRPRKTIQESVKGIARVIVPLCLSLPKKLPKSK
jgi:hypothetical protein